MTNEDDRGSRTAEEIVAAQWTYLLEDGAELIRPDAVRAAHAQARLRSLFPAVGHGVLFFSATTEFPYSRVGGTVYYA
ncbi:DUF6193 family natural product biosynthesis protein [Streptosporangium subroseum]|uniref:DUF6193 family natural product biosynthesis protein n=1 Tax=Streptosporangium subroseum TaxID=106412 RepID=UPI003089CD69|nr:DUF6193 family natural product biosynthesis protein [Streptosporangium subroseum]